MTDAELQTFTSIMDALVRISVSNTNANLLFVSFIVFIYLGRASFLPQAS